MYFLTLDLKKKLITSEETFKKNLRRMVVYKVLQSKVEIVFFLTLILFYLAWWHLEKYFAQPRISYSRNKINFLMKTFYSIKNHFGYFIREWISTAVI